ncbi:unnamed protein product [Owenia fusiformis]|uniref:Uncharacterized protein n=1 Tax=Owenia fusiformis TaxID=6347 RepID=A0A8J1Y6X5_OWEFU|nr:unnamed protein product [Owenia fusiformis]
MNGFFIDETILYKADCRNPLSEDELIRNDALNSSVENQGLEELLNYESKTMFFYSHHPDHFALFTPDAHWHQGEGLNTDGEHITDWGAIVQQTGHKASDMISSCVYDGESCKDNITMKLTDFGMCYTFRTNRNCTRPGATYGLQLLLNAEIYEYMAGPRTDAGIKVLMHSPDDEPMVKGLGFSVAPGLHSLIAIKASETYSIPKPWGSCASKDLTYFDKYTQVNCMRECLTKNVVDLCGCRTEFMPYASENDPPVCDMHSYFDCIIPNIDTANITTTNCQEDCNEQCEKFVYEPMLSFGAMSELSVDEVLNKDISGELKDKYYNAINVQTKTNKYKFLNVQRVFRDLSTSMKVFQQFLDKWVFAETNIFKKVEDGASAMNEYFKNDAMLTNTDRTHFNIDNILLDFRNNILVFTESLFSSLNEVEQYMHGLSAGYKSDWVQFRNLTKTVNTFVELKAHEFGNFVVRQTLSLPSCNQFSNLKDLLDDLTGAYYVWNLNTEGFRKNKITLKTCLDNLHTNLTNVVLLKEQLESMYNASFIIEAKDQYPDLSSSHSVISEKAGDIFDIVELFLENNPSYDFMITITEIEELIAPVQGELNILTDTILLKYMTISSEILSSYDKIGRENYARLLQVMLGVQQYFPSSDVFRYDEMNIWDEPYVVFDRDQHEYETRFRPIKSEIKQAFIKTKGKEKSTAIIKSFFESLKPQLDVFEKEYRAAKINIEEALDDVENLIEDSKKHGKLDDQFVKRNFLELDIYYSKLAYQNIQQMKALDEESVLSDIGGFMGLLLGASVLTVFEILDLIFYNIGKKLRSKRNFTPIKVSPLSTERI